MPFTANDIAVQQVQDRLKSLQQIVHDIERKRSQSEQGINTLQKYAQDDKSGQSTQKLKSLYKAAISQSEQEEDAIRKALQKIAEIRNIKNERIQARIASNKESIRIGTWMKMLSSSAQTLPLYVSKIGEKPPPLCGAVPADPNYVAKVGDMVAALAKVSETNSEDWILAEVVGYNHATSKYEVHDILKEQNQKDRYTLSRRHVIPLPLMRADPEIDPQALFPQGTLEKVILLKAIMQYSLQFLSVDLNNCCNNSEAALYSTRHLAVVVDGDCENITALINKELDKKYFFETFHWLILATGKSKRNVLHVLDKAKLNINSEVHVTVCNEDVNNNNCTIYDVYNPASEHGGKLRINVIGYYNINGYEARRTENKYWSRRNMTGVTFKTAVVLPRLDVPLMEYINNDEKRQINSMHRFQTVCVNYCRDFFNFSLLTQRTNSWGYIQADGHFDGLVSLLERRIVDFGSSPLILKVDRLPVVDYSYGNWILRSTFIYRRPKAVAESYQIFLRPLDKWVWMCILVVMVVMVVATKIVFSHELTSTHSVRNGLDSTWSFLCLFTFGAFCQQGAIVFPKFCSSRILSIFVYLFCILIYQFYSAAIVSYLMMDPPRTINNLKDLVESELRVGIEDILIDRNYFVQTTDPVAIELFEKKIKGATNESGFYAPAQGLELVGKGGFAFHVETSTAYPIIEATFSNEHICELEEVQMYRTQPMYTNLPKKSPFKEMMNYCMYKLAENGNMDRLRKHWDARKPACIESAKKTAIHVSLREFKCGLLSLAYGMCFAMVFIVLETVICYRRVVMERAKAKVQATLPSLYPYLN